MITLILSLFPFMLNIHLFWATKTAATEMTLLFSFTLFSSLCKNLVFITRTLQVTKIYFSPEFFLF